MKLRLLDDGSALRLSVLAFVLFVVLAVQLVRWKGMAETEKDLARADTVSIRTAHQLWLTRVADVEAKLRQLEKRSTWGKPGALLPALSGVADQLSLSLVGVEELRGWRRGGYNAVPLQLTLSGDYGGFAAFLSAVERLTPMARIDEIRFYQRKRHKDTLWLSLTLSPMSKVDGSDSAAEIEMPPVERLSVKSNPFGFHTPALKPEYVQETPLPQLTGILWDDADSIAIFETQSARAGDVIAGATIVSIGPQRVIVVRGTRQHKLKLWKLKAVEGGE